MFEITVYSYMTSSVHVSKYIKIVYKQLIYLFVPILYNCLLRTNTSSINKKIITVSFVPTEECYLSICLRSIELALSPHCTRLLYHNKKVVYLFLLPFTCYVLGDKLVVACDTYGTCLVFSWLRRARSLIFNRLSKILYFLSNLW